MGKLLDGGLRKTIARATKALFLDGVLQREEQGVPTNPWEEPSKTWVPYPCKAIAEEYEERLHVDGTVTWQHRKFLVLADTVATEPRETDRFEFQGETFTVLTVQSDPAKATWVLHCKL